MVNKGLLSLLGAVPLLTTCFGPRYYERELPTTIEKVIYMDDGDHAKIEFDHGDEPIIYKVKREIFDPIYFRMSAEEKVAFYENPLDALRVVSLIDVNDDRYIGDGDVAILLLSLRRRTALKKIVNGYFPGRLD